MMISLGATVQINNHYGGAGLPGDCDERTDFGRWPSHGDVAEKRLYWTVKSICNGHFSRAWSGRGGVSPAKQPNVGPHKRPGLQTCMCGLTTLPVPIPAPALRQGHGGRDERRIILLCCHPAIRCAPSHLLLSATRCVSRGGNWRLVIRSLPRPLRAAAKRCRELSR